MPAAISMEFFHLALLGSGMRAIRAKRPPQLSPGTERLPTPFLSSYIIPWVSPRTLLDFLKTHVGCEECDNGY